jgi:hypothetical protein
MAKRGHWQLMTLKLTVHKTAALSYVFCSSDLKQGFKKVKIY